MSKKSLTVEDVIYIGEHYVPGDAEFGIKALAEKFGASRDAVKDAAHGETYKNIERPLHKPQGRISDETKAAIALSEETAQALAKRYNISVASVRKIWHAAGKPVNKRAVITDELRQAILAEYVPYDKEHGRLALSQKYGISTAALGVILRALPKERHRRESVQVPKAGLLDELKEAIIIAYDEEHLSVRALSERFSVSREVVKSVLQEAGVEMRKRNPSTPLDDELIAEVRKLYSTGEYSVRELTERFNVNRAALSKVLADIEPPKPKAPTVDQATLERVLSLYGRGHGVQPIAKTVGLPQSLVRKIINGEPF